MDNRSHLPDTEIKNVSAVGLAGDGMIQVAGRCALPTEIEQALCFTIHCHVKKDFDQLANFRTSFAVT